MNTKYEKYINYIVNDIKPPFFKDANSGYGYGLSEKEFEMVLSKVFNQPVTITKDGDIFDKKGNQLYFENNYRDKNYWSISKYDDNGNQIKLEDSDGDWTKWEYDERGNNIYYEDNHGYWSKYDEYDDNGNVIYHNGDYTYFINDSDMWERYE